MPLSTLHVLYILLSLQYGHAGFNSEAEEKVLRDLVLNKLTKNSPPGAMVNDTVFTFVDLYQIADVDEKNGILTLKMWTYIYYWMDQPLWDPAQYSGVMLGIYVLHVSFFHPFS